MTFSEFVSDFRRFCKRLTGRSHTSTFSATADYPDPESLLQKSLTRLGAEGATELPELIAAKIEAVRHFHIADMQTAVAICTCGSSGSLLLASYLEGHPDVIGLPMLYGQAIYPFFDHYQSMSLREKLLTYPFVRGSSSDDFDDSFKHAPAGITPIHYVAAVDAVLSVYRDRPASFLEQRRTFFVFVHIAYSVALGHKPRSATPVIVHGQHIWDNELARRFVEDFQDARFIHTVRDPISNLGRLLARHTDSLIGAAMVVSHLSHADAPQTGMESRTRTIRFEDLHLNLEPTMRAVAAWLGLPFQPSLLESNFYGVPFVASRGATSWSGPRPDQAVRDIKNVSLTDRGMLYATLYEDFASWNYPCPGVFAYAPIRVVTCLLLMWIPFRIEIIVAKAFFKSLPKEGIGYALQGFARLFAARVAIMVLLVADLVRRLAGRKTVLTLWPAASAQIASAPITVRE
jgi:hypothetical protein